MCKPYKQKERESFIWYTAKKENLTWLTIFTKDGHIEVNREPIA